MPLAKPKHRHRIAHTWTGSFLKIHTCVCKAYRYEVNFDLPQRESAVTRWIPANKNDTQLWEPNIPIVRRRNF